MKIKLAVFKDGDRGRVMDITEHGSWILNDDDYIQITEIIEVEFQPLKDVDVVGKQVAAIDRKIKEFKAATQVKLNQMEQAKQELLSLSHSEAD